MRVACSVILMTGVLSILYQLTMCDTADEFKNIEWMQPISLIWGALAGKIGQKQIEKPAVDTK